MKHFSKSTLQVMAVILAIPSLLEVPTIMRWTQSQTFSMPTDKYSDQANLTQTSSFFEQPHVSVFGTTTCGYTRALLQDLNKENIPYIFHDLGNPISEDENHEYVNVLRDAGVFGSYTMPAVRVGDKGIVSGPTRINDVVQALFEQGKLSFDTLPSILTRIGGRTISIFTLEVGILLCCWLTKEYGYIFTRGD
jgi:glutaredoxin